ncbi:MAG: 4-hydroxy-tetrahydrodipicolinate reductase [Actinomycetota bacterium]|jgi:4-hydroxy-tetrahydrodipicolinate reductase
MNIVISGYGKMGKEIFSILQERDDITLFTTDDICGFEKATASESVCIDFTTPEAFRKNYRFIADSFRAAVIGTTGWNDIKEEVTGYFRERGTTMIYASNFSIGVNIFFEIARISSAILASSGNYDPYITELHHKFKLDSPSGTAGTIRDIVEKETGKKCSVQSVRCGYIPGTHNLGFESEVDRIVLTHEAFSRRGFAAGAVQAAYWTSGLEGVFDFREILRENFDKRLNNERD